MVSGDINGDISGDIKDPFMSPHNFAPGLNLSQDLLANKYLTPTQNK